MKTKFGSQSWFQENLHTGCISTKDALKFSLIYPLEDLLVSHFFVSVKMFMFWSIGFPMNLYRNLLLQECKSSMGNFRIRLTYTHTKASKGDQNRSDSAETCKRRKIGMLKFIIDPVLLFSWCFYEETENIWHWRIKLSCYFLWLRTVLCLSVWLFQSSGQSTNNWIHEYSYLLIKWSSLALILPFCAGE